MGEIKFFIETERLVLREFRLSDAADFFEMDSNPEVHQYLGNNPVTTMEQIHASISSLHRQYAEFGIGRWATFEKTTGKFIGWSGLKFNTETKNNQSGYYDVGYRFSPEFWGKGYATESAKAALDFGFGTLQLNEIIGTCHEKNRASRKALEKCGLKFIEKFKNNDFNCDWLRITKQEWEIIPRRN